MKTVNTMQKSAGKHKRNKKNFYREENEKTFFKKNHESAEKHCKRNERHHRRNETVLSCGKAANTGETESVSPTVKSSSPENESIITEIKKISLMFFSSKYTEINNSNR
jgi:hypothetical protein